MELTTTNIFEVSEIIAKHSTHEVNVRVHSAIGFLCFVAIKKTDINYILTNVKKENLAVTLLLEEDSKNIFLSF